MECVRQRIRSLIGLAVLALAANACSAAIETGESSTSSLPTSTTFVDALSSSTTTEPPATTTTSMALVDRCLERAEFGEAVASPYVLPFPPGDGYSIIQSYCHDDGSHENQLAYDFAMPLGSIVVAAREGAVVDVKEDVADDAHTRHLNYVVIRHDDGTAGFYAHLQHDGALVEVSDEVVQGQEIGLSGATGRTGGPVLHFGVYRTFPPVDDRDVPVVFSNSDGALDARGGLREGTFYRALPHDTVD